MIDDQNTDRPEIFISGTKWCVVKEAHGKRVYFSNSSGCEIVYSEQYSIGVEFEICRTKACGPLIMRTE